MANSVQEDSNRADRLVLDAAKTLSDLLLEVRTETFWEISLEAKIMSRSHEDHLDLESNLFRSNLQDLQFFLALGALERLRQYASQRSIPFLNEIYGLTRESPNKVQRNVQRLREVERDLATATAIVRFLSEADRIKAEDKPEIPNERPAPIRVKVESNRIVLSNPRHIVGPVGSQSIDKIRKALASNVQSVIEELGSDSNIDRRLVKVFAAFLENLLESTENLSVEAIGIQLDLVERLANKFGQEINDIVLEQIHHIVENAKIMLAQFEEWRNYLDEAKRLNSAGIDGNDLVSKSDLIASEFEKHEEVVEPKIISRLRNMIEPVLNGMLQSESISAPLVASLSNIFSAISEIAIGAANHAGTPLASTMLLASAHMLIPFCVKFIRSFFPLFSQFQPLKFVVSTFEYIDKRYSQLRDITRL